MACVGALLAMLLHAFTLPPEEHYSELLADGKYQEIVDALFEDYQLDAYQEDQYAISQAISRNAAAGMKVLDRLHADPRPLASSIEAELLLHVARGPEMKPWDLKKQASKMDVVSSEQVCKRAMGMMDNPDIFIRGMADFAIAIRVGLENSESLKEYPGSQIPGWWTPWMESKREDVQIEYDYVRQASLRRIHRSTDALNAEVEHIGSRAAMLLDHIQQYGTREEVIEAEAKYTEFHALAENMKKSSELEEARAYYVALRLLARELVLLNPDLDFERIVFSQQHAFHNFGNITNGGKSFAVKPGGDIYIKEGLSPSGELKGLISQELGPGHTRGYELHYEADRIIFSFAPQPRYYNGIFYESDQGFDDNAYGLSETNNIYEADLEGNVRQITNDPFHMDVEPTYLPNGDIVFSSDRSNYGSQCCGSFYQNKRIINQYRMASDGTGIRDMSRNVHFDRYNHVLDNGQLIYTRWEYQERHLWQTHNLWTSRPDGSYADALYKQHINAESPMALRDARQIYGTNKLVAIGCGHHEWEQGAVMVIDPAMGINDPDGMINVTPNISSREGGLGKTRVPESGGVPDAGGLYQQPFALSENSFLVSYSYNFPRAITHGFNFGLYYIDIYGHKELVHQDPVLSAWYPVPLKKRDTPPVLTEFQDDEKDYGLVYITDVNQGVPEVEKGQIKYIRIGHHTQWPAEQIDDQPHNYNHLHYIPSGSWSRTLGMTTWGPARVIGTVPVEEDGSAYFKVPADYPVYFQALDENMLELRRMRSFVTLQRGEVRGCTGCHETRDEAPQGLTHIPSALGREPSLPEAPSWGETILPDYEAHIHSIFERNCMECHGEKEPAGGLEFSSRRIDGYYQAYRTLFGLGAEDPTPVQEIHAFELNYGKGHNVVKDVEALKKMEENTYPGQLVTISNKFGDNSVTGVKAFGSANSRLIEVLLSEAHQEMVQLDQGEWVDLVSWIDVNAPYWGSFIDKEPVRTGGTSQPDKNRDWHAPGHEIIP